MPSALSAPPPEGSPAGPLGPGESAAVSSLPPLVDGSKLHTSLKITARQIEWVFRARREHEGRTVIKEEQMPDGRRKLILKDESTGAFSDVVA